MKEKFITFPKGHWIPNKDVLRGKAYCKYQNSWNHTTNACWVFRNVIQNRVNKGILKFLDKKEAMAIDEDPFPLVASINTASFNLRALIESKREGKLSPRKVWVPKYCLIRVDRLKKEWVTVFIDLSLRRNSMGIQQRTKQHNQFSKKRKLSPKGKMNSLEEEFILPREKVIEKPIPLWGMFISLRENDTSRFKECSSRKRAFSPRGKFTLLNEKSAWKVKSLRKKAGERHVSPLRLMIPKGGPISPRNKMMFTKENFTSPRGRLFSSRENISDNFTSPRIKGKGKTCFSNHICFSRR